MMNSQRYPYAQSPQKERPFLPMPKRGILGRVGEPRSSVLLLLGINVSFPLSASSPHSNLSKESADF